MSRISETIKRNRQQIFALNITSMMDMFTIILVFLLKTYSVTPVMNLSDGLTPPKSTQLNDVEDNLTVSLSKDGILVGTENILSFEGDIPKEMLKENDMIITPLFNKLLETAEKTRSIASTNEDLKEEGKLLFFADSSLPYSQIKKVMYTAYRAGYFNLKFAVIKTSDL